MSLNQLLCNGCFKDFSRLQTEFDLPKAQWQNFQFNCVLMYESYALATSKAPEMLSCGIYNKSKTYISLCFADIILARLPQSIKNTLQYLQSMWNLNSVRLVGDCRFGGTEHRSHLNHAHSNCTTAHENQLHKNLHKWHKNILQLIKAECICTTYLLRTLPTFLSSKCIIYSVLKHVVSGMTSMEYPGLWSSFQGGDLDEN